MEFDFGGGDAMLDFPGWQFGSVPPPSQQFPGGQSGPIEEVIGTAAGATASVIGTQTELQGG